MRKKEVGRLTALVLSAALLLCQAPVTVLAQEGAETVTGGNNIGSPDQQPQTVSDGNAGEYVLNDESGIPDRDLYNALLQQGDEMNGNKDGKLSKSEAKAISWLSLNQFKGRLTNLSVYAPDLQNFSINNWVTPDVYTLQADDLKEIGNLSRLTGLNLNEVRLEGAAELARLHSLNALSLRGSGLSDAGFITAENFPELTTLTLEGSAVTVLPEGIRGLRKLTQLTISNCGLSSLSGISDLTQLQNLDLSSNTLEAEDIEGFTLEDLPSLRWLSLSGNALYELPEAVGGWTQLISLALGSCGLRKLADLTGMTQLETLSLYGNMLTEEEIRKNVPAEFSGDASWMSSNFNPSYDPAADEYYKENREPVTNDENGIPDKALYSALLYQGDEMSGNKDGILTVGEARKIYYVNCPDGINSYSNLAEFCPNVTGLFVSNWNRQYWDNAQASFISEYGKLKKLNSLTIIAYSDSLLAAICENRSLISLTLDGNVPGNLSPVAGLPLQFFSVAGVKADSGIETVVNSLEELTSLTVYGDFEIAQIDSGRKACLNSVSFHITNLMSEPRSYDLSEYLAAKNISLSAPIQSVTGMEGLSLSSLQLNNTAVERGKLDRLPDGLFTLSVSNFAVEKLEGDLQIVALKSLTELSLNHCGIKNIDGISGLSSLRKLSLADNEITDISEITALKNLYYLNLHKNQIVDITGIGKLTELEWLYLAENRLEVLPDLTGLSKLSSNNLNSAPGLTLTGNRLTKKDITGNVPEGFSDNRVWLAEAAARRINGMTCYTDLDSQTIVDILYRYNPQGAIYSTINMVSDGEAVCTPELMRFIKEGDIHLTLNYVDEQTGVTKICYYLESTDPLPDITENIVLKYAAQTGQIEGTEAAEKYFAEFGEIPIYYYQNNLPRNVQEIPRSIWLSAEQADNGQYNLYYFDYEEKKISKVDTYYLYQGKAMFSNFAYNNSGRIIDPARNRTSEEGYYFLANSRYQPVSSAPGEYAAPSLYKGEILGSGAELDRALTDMIASAKAKDTLSFAFKGYGYVNADSWNEAFKKKLNWEITYLDYNGCVMSVVKMDGNSIQKVKNKSTVDLSASIYAFYPPEPLRGYFKGLTAGAVDRADLCIREEISLYVGRQFKNGETLNLYFLRTPVATATGNNTVPEDNTYKLWKSGVKPVTVERGMVAFQVKEKKGILLLVNGKLDLKADPEPEQPVVPEPETPEEPELGQPDEQPFVDGKQPPAVIDESRIVEEGKALDTIIENMGKLDPNVEVYTRKPVTLDKKLFQDMSKKNKNVSVSVVNEDNQLMYGWTFRHDQISGEKLKEFEKLDLGISFATEKQKEIEAVTHNTDALYLSFTHHGELPAPATIKTYVGNKYPDGAVVYLYYYNEDTGRVEAINDGNGTGGSGLTVRGGYVTYTITHCSIYFLAEAAPEQIGISGGSENGSDLGDQGGEQAAVLSAAAFKAPKTGEGTSYLCFLIPALLISLAGMAAVYRKEAVRKRRATYICR